MNVSHLAREGSVAPVCGSKAKSLRVTWSPVSAECARCRKAAGLGKYDPLAALRGMFSQSAIAKATGSAA